MWTTFLLKPEEAPHYSTEVDFYFSDRGEGHVIILNSNKLRKKMFDVSHYLALGGHFEQKATTAGH